MKYLMYMFVYILIGIFAIYSCGNNNDENEHFVESKDDNMTDTLDKVDEDTLTEREELVMVLEERRENIKVKMREYRADLQTMKAESKAKMQEMLDEMEKSAEQVDRKLEEMEETTEENFKKLGAETDTLLMHIEQGLDSMKVKITGKK